LFAFKAFIISSACEECGVAIKTVLISSFLRISSASDEQKLNLNLSDTFFEVMPFDVTTPSNDAPHEFTQGIK